jgi:hypothetical protein
MLCRRNEGSSCLNPTREEGCKRYQASAPAAGRAHEATCFSSAQDPLSPLVEDTYSPGKRGVAQLKQLFAPYKSLVNPGEKFTRLGEELTYLVEAMARRRPFDQKGGMKIKQPNLMESVDFVARTPSLP